MMRAMGASNWQIFRYVKLPSSADQFFSGLRISASYSVVGAVISEWLGGFESPEISVKETVKSLKNHPLMPKDVRISGYIIDSVTGELTKVETE